MQQILDVRQLAVGNIILMVAYDIENCQHNEPEGWVSHTARVVQIDTGRNIHGVTSLDSAAVTVQYLSEGWSQIEEHLSNTRTGQMIDYNNARWNICLLQEDGTPCPDGDVDELEDALPVYVDPFTKRPVLWGADLS
jgi:hypothetical protein